MIIYNKKIIKKCIMIIVIINYILLGNTIKSYAQISNESERKYVQNRNNNQDSSEKRESKILSLEWEKESIALNPQFSIDEKESRSGKGSLTIKGPGAGCWSASAPVNPHKKYTISYYFKTKTPVDNNLKASLHAAVTQRGSKGSKTVLWVNESRMKNHKEWTKIILGSYIPQEGVTHIKLQLYLNANRKKELDSDDSKIWFDDIQIVESELSVIKKPGNLISESSDYTLWSAPPFHSVYKDDPTPKSPGLGKNISIRSAKGEKEAFQLIVNPQVKWDQVTWEWSNFSGPKIIHRDAMRFYRVEYVPLPEQDKNLKDYLRGGIVPDPLPPEKLSSLLPHQNNPFWFLVSVPQDAPMGLYKTTLKLKNKDKIMAVVPVELKVFDFAIPQEPTFDAQSSLYAHFLPYYEHGDLTEITKRYWANLTEHRTVTAGLVMPIKVDKDAHGRARLKTEPINFEKGLAFQKKLGWCKHLHLHWDNLRLNSGNVFFHPSLGIRIFQDQENTKFDPQFVPLFRDLVTQLMDTLKRNGCYSHPRFKISDEPNISDPRQVNFYTNIAKLLKEIDPNIYPLSAGHYHLNFLPYYNQWYFDGPNAQFYQREMALAEKKNSKQVYQNNMVSPIFSPLRMRLFFWALWKENFTGLYWWQINGWGRFEKSVGGKPREFVKRHPWQGDFSGVILIYPPREGKNEEGPINSLRWEAMRKGLEDYEYLVILDRLIKAKEGKIPPVVIAKAKKALGRVDELIDHIPNIPGSAAFNDHFHTYDNSLIEDVRNEIAESIETLMTANNKQKHY
jgi:hypothetical protein